MNHYIKNSNTDDKVVKVKLKMFGVPIDCSADIFCNNTYFVMSSKIPTSILNKTINQYKARHVVCSVGYC